MPSFSVIKLLHFVSRDARAHLCVLENLFPKSFSNISESRIEPSQVVDYLINSCGLSPETAVSVAKKVHGRFHTSEKPDSVLKFFECIGFSRTHIARLISLKPLLLFSSVDKTLKPKLKPFQDLGLSGPELAKVIASNPAILVRSLRTQIVPSLKVITSFVGTGENMLKTLKRSRWVLSINPGERLQPNIDFLRNQNVPDSRIAYLMMTQPGNLILKPDHLKEKVETLKGLGFKPESGMFTIGIHILGSMSKSTWEAKIKLLKDFGWSERQIFAAFRKHPAYMACSEKKMKQGMNFFANVLNWNAEFVSKHPKLLMFSFKERIIPRFEVWKILVSKGLISKVHPTLVTAWNMSEENFLEKYVNKYEDKVPDLVYKMRNWDGKLTESLENI
ncbi:uncharacterized protein LOC122089188 [Macadamia integrifolia]|uniref:uncharacterized protein LOC122089188 n=1 Tax=Macadamia integrifolia TaxID=60698 RepID=UPI001C4E45D0|nr:uncharacterized protein LOC122089188 [Macadamia integrifolia]